MLVGPAVHNLPCPMWTLFHSLEWMMAFFRYGSDESHLRMFSTQYYVSPVWAITCVQPLHTFRTFSPSSSERFRRDGEDRKGSVVASWPCLLPPHRNKSPSPEHRTGATLFFIQQRQQQKGRAVIEWYWSTNYKTERSPAMMMYEHEVGVNSLVQLESINAPRGRAAWNAFHIWF